MNKKFFLTLLSSPVLFASVTSMVMMTQPAHAAQATQVFQKVAADGTRLSCMQSPHTNTVKIVCIKVSNTAATTSKTQLPLAQVNPNQQPTELAFSDKDSDEAIRLFNCDCPACINAARALHGLAPIPV